MSNDLRRIVNVGLGDMASSEGAVDLEGEALCNHI